MHRFFIENNNFNNDNSIIILVGENAKHINVLHEKIGNQVIVCDGAQTDYICSISKITKDEVILDVINSYASYAEPNIKITLFQGLPKSDKLEFIIQKCVELGVYEIVPVETEFCVSRMNAKNAKKTERLQKISESAAKQCGRGIIPIVRETVSFSKAIELLKKMDESYVAYEKENNSSPHENFKDIRGNNIGIFIGPEGGFSQDEISGCIQNNIQPISLGKRILRTETAGLTALIILLYTREEL